MLQETFTPSGPPTAVSPSRIWIDGCFDFTHHGHAGAILQAKKLGTHLCAGIHSDASILANKGPAVMSLPERLSTIAACRWVDTAIPNAPYVTEPAWMDHHGCQYVVHGDDVTTDASGEDCYRVVKAAGRFKVVKRTPGISTTDLVGRMLLCTRTHHMPELGGVLGSGTEEAAEMVQRLRAYASDRLGTEGRGPPVYAYTPAAGCAQIVPGLQRGSKRLVYVDGGFDLFTPGHIEFLRRVHAQYAEGEEIYVVVGVHSDRTINTHKGLNYPIMSQFERALCVLQCRYTHALILDAPYVPDARFLDSLGETFGGAVAEVWHGPTNFMEGDEDTYAEAARRGVYREIGEHRWMGVNAGEIVGRILMQREVYEERQRKKGVKAEVEKEMVN
ncbi:hypothetical protein EDC01DRAFT_724076 [Geopyxis carbonaria]|nr:hypothetical protein EDC01DRAFT_724076 [Geopyxis carbonaria]